MGDSVAETAIQDLKGLVAKAKEDANTIKKLVRINKLLRTAVNNTNLEAVLKLQNELTDRMRLLTAELKSLPALEQEQKELLANMEQERKDLIEQISLKAKGQPGLEEELAKLEQEAQASAKAAKEANDALVLMQQNIQTTLVSESGRDRDFKDERLSDSDDNEVDFLTQSELKKLDVKQKQSEVTKKQREAQQKQLRFEQKKEQARRNQELINELSSRRDYIQKVLNNEVKIVDAVEIKKSSITAETHALKALDESISKPLDAAKITACIAEVLDKYELEDTGWRHAKIRAAQYAALKYAAGLSDPNEQMAIVYAVYKSIEVDAKSRWNYSGNNRLRDLIEEKIIAGTRTGSDNDYSSTLQKYTEKNVTANVTSKDVVTKLGQSLHKGGKDVASIIKITNSLEAVLPNNDKVVVPQKKGFLSSFKK